MIGFYDFDPDANGSIAGAVRQVSAWVDQHSVNVVNIETIVLPQSVRTTPAASIMPAQVGAIASRQVVRVWYQADKTIPAPAMPFDTYATPNTRSFFDEKPPIKMGEV